MWGKEYGYDTKDKENYFHMLLGISKQTLEALQR